MKEVSNEEEAEQIKEHFNFMKKLLLKEKIQEIDLKIHEIKAHTDKEFIELLNEIKEKKKLELQAANSLRKYRLESLNHMFQAKDQAIRQNAENNKEMLYYTIQSDLKKEFEQLKDARHKADLNTILWCRQREDRSIKRKPKLISSPCIVYMLKEEEILEDLIAIKQSLKPEIADFD